MYFEPHVRQCRGPRGTSTVVLESGSPRAVTAISVRDRDSVRAKPYNGYPHPGGKHAQIKGRISIPRERQLK